MQNDQQPTDHPRRSRRWLWGLLLLPVLAGVGFYYYRQYSQRPMPPSRIYFGSVRNGREEIFCMNPDGTDQRRLVSVAKRRDDRMSHASPYGMNYARATGVSPDGKLLAYTISSKNGKRKEIFLMNADGGQQKFVTEGEEPTFTPDGRTLNYSLRNKYYSISLDGSNKQPRIIDPTQMGAISATSPDGKLKACCASTGMDDIAIYLMNNQGRPDRLITREKGIIMHLSFSPDGKKIAYDLMHEEDGDIYLINIDGTDRKALTQSRQDWCPVWGLIPAQP